MSISWGRPRMRRTLHMRKPSARRVVEDGVGGVKPERGGRVKQPPRLMMKEKAGTPQPEDRRTGTGEETQEPTAAPEAQDTERRSLGDPAERTHTQGAAIGKCTKAEGMAERNLENAADQTGTNAMKDIARPESRRESVKAALGETKRKVTQRGKRGKRTNQRWRRLLSAKLQAALAPATSITREHTPRRAHGSAG